MLHVQQGGLRLWLQTRLTFCCHHSRLEILKHIGAYDQTLSLTSMVSMISEMNIIRIGICV